MKRLFVTVSLFLVAFAAFAQFENKAIFSVSQTKKVRFSHGNLQYQASTGTWRFALNQYDLIGTNNKNISSTYTGWIDLFGFGTSGWESGAVAYQPNSTNTSNTDYYVGGSESNSLTDDYSQADWGTSYTEQNGGSPVWRTLTYEEWDYLLFRRKNASSKFGLATVNNKQGCVLLPDNWTKPNGLNFTSGTANKYTGSNNNNVYTADNWAKMEANGAVFLPAAGYRSGDDGKNVGGVGENGDYWTVSTGGSNFARYLYIFEKEVYLNFSRRSYGVSVRLVSDVE